MKPTIWAFVILAAIAYAIIGISTANVGATPLGDFSITGPVLFQDRPTGAGNFNENVMLDSSQVVKGH